MEINTTGKSKKPVNHYNQTAKKPPGKTSW